ncbi:MAG: class I SAM-dependent methyltransferase [Candidatus Binatia bacterium]
MSASDFYDGLAPYYHLIFENWEASIERQGTALDSLIRSFGPPGARSVLDVACGIGTQTLGLASRGYDLTASDISPVAVARARVESARSHLKINFSVADMRVAHTHHANTFDVVLCADNSLPHLLTDDEILQALEQFFACTRAGGLCIISVRDYAALEKSGLQFKPYGVRVEGHVRYALFQVWEWHGSLYDMHFYIVRDDGTETCQTQVMRSTYYAISIAELMELMARAGFDKVQRLDDVFFQPVVVGIRSSPS